MVSGGLTPGNVRAYVEQGLFIPFDESIPSLEFIFDYWASKYKNMENKLLGSDKVCMSPEEKFDEEYFYSIGL